MKAEIVKDGEDCILILPDEICQELNLKLGDTLVYFTNEYGEACFRKVDEREEL